LVRHDHDGKPELGPLETLGVRLGLWKPRDVEVPPLERRKLASVAAVVVGLVAAGAGIAIPAIDSGKESGAGRDAREAAEARAAERRRLREEQAAKRGRGDPSSRARLLADVRASIEADARARVRAGELRGRIARVECEAGRRAGSRVSYDCTAVTREIAATGYNVPGRTGYPFVAVVDLASGRYSWCKTNPVPGERVIPDPRDVVELPRACVL
jgi:hypothetical protein